ncbi:MAG TPA: DUF6328 family protein [Nitrososphaeraceae archaeon]|jgi:hypothetical protein
MSSDPDDDPVMRSSTEHYDRVGVSFRWPQILAAASSIFFGFLLDIAVNPPSYFRMFDSLVLLTSLYLVTIATAMFIMPVIYHISSYLRFDVERFLARTRHYTLIGIICVMLAMYLGLGLAMNSKLPFQVAYSLPTLPFIFITIEFFKYSPTDLVKSTSTERYDRMGAAMRWCQILASGSSIFFGFLLHIAVDPPSYFTFFDNMILLAALYSVTVATAMFILPVIFHSKYYRRLDVERFLLRTKKPVQIGIICITLAMYMGLGLALNSKLPIEIAYVLASIPSIFILYEFFNLKQKKSNLS